MALSTPLQLIYAGVNIHELGEVSVMSQQSQFSSEDIPQKESRTIHVRIETWDRGYDLNYQAIRELREALSKQNRILKWVTPGINGGAGTTQLERPAIVNQHDLPEDPNAWGVYQQQINITFAYEMDRKDTSVNLSAFVTGAGSPVSLGHVMGWNEDFRNNFYSEIHDDRSRSSGSISLTGEIYYELGETGSSSDTRRVNLLAHLESLRAIIQVEKSIDLKFGHEGNYFFDKTVKVESFVPTINQVANKITWSLSCIYTIFPEEDGYAAAEFTTALGRDKETGEETLAITGKVVAKTEVLALAKLASLVATSETAYSYTPAKRIREDVTKNWINVEDTEHENKWMELSFNYGYRQKMSGILTYVLTISDEDDLTSGLLRRTYSGNVVASGADADAAYAVALAQARTLGDKKHEFRLTSSEVREDRKQNAQDKEFVRLNFSYSYKLKGSRIYMEMRSSTAENAFGEAQQSVSGFIVAVDETTARANYLTLARNGYASRIIRQETTDVTQDRAQLGAAWYGSSGFSTMFSRLDFSFAVFKPKSEGTYGLKYGIRISTDFNQLLTSSSISGVFVGSATIMAAIEAGTTNPLDTFLNSYVAQLGPMSTREIDVQAESTGTLSDRLMVNFSATFTKKTVGEATILRCTLSESITYSGTRWVFQPSPEGADTPQDLGITQATRTVSGSITAATEAAAESWLAIQRGATGLMKTWPTGTPGTADASAKEMPAQVNREFGMMDMESGLARGEGANFRTVTLTFTFNQVIPNLQPPWG